ncbi:hypothetical protein ACTXT7_006454 [Hymenolepis weldensis]
MPRYSIRIKAFFRAKTKALEDDKYKETKEIDLAKPVSLAKVVGQTAGEAALLSLEYRTTPHVHNGKNFLSRHAALTFKSKRERMESQNSEDPTHTPDVSEDLEKGSRPIKCPNI